MSLQDLKQLQKAGFLGSLDLQIAGLVSRMHPAADEQHMLAAALASRAIGEGHACVDLTAYAGKSWADILLQHRPQKYAMEHADAAAEHAATEQYAALGSLPAIQDWINALDPAIFGTGDEQGKARTLLVRNDTRIYLRRYWNYERRVEAKLISLHCTTGLKVSDKALATFFSEDAGQQKTAARKAIENKLSLLSGGPGTGKTYTLARAVALLDAISGLQDRKLHVRMVAPTGKAAVRMVESIKQAKEDLRKEGKPEESLAAIPEEATTIHRLLAPRYRSPYFRHDAANPIAADLVIVDEASMVDLPLMAKLLDALPGECALMLVGDIDQLASVEPGRVYGDVCRAAEDHGPLAGCLTRLTISRRFPASSAIGNISRLVNDGRADQAWQTLRENRNCNELSVLDAEGFTDNNPDFSALVKEQMRGFVAETDPATALAKAAGFRVLCALRNGPYGVTRINRQIENILCAQGLQPDRRCYDHQIIMITVNTPTLHLYNGDVGVILAKPGNQKALEAWFPDTTQGVRAIPVGLLPNHETAFAMTVHKSQGSEFPYLALILPDTGTSPVLTRELLYTAMTRVSIDPDKRAGRLHVWCTESSFKGAVERQTARATGLFHGSNQRHAAASAAHA
jgi:exodeoxyribonuclease V alpha subunit